MLNVDVCTAQASAVGCPGSPHCSLWKWLHYVVCQAVGRVGHNHGRYVDPLDVPADWREKGAILQLAVQTGVLENVCIVAVAKPTNIEIKEGVSVE